VVAAPGNVAVVLLTETPHHRCWRARGGRRDLQGLLVDCCLERHAPAVS